VEKICLDGVEMAVSASADIGVVSSDTTLRFEQRGAVVSARYRGGRVVDGYLIGHLEGDGLTFRYVQADTDGNLDAGFSRGVIERTADGKWRLVEHFTWATRPGGGVNIFEETGFAATSSAPNLP
jgi:hypothetical protein